MYCLAVVLFYSVELFFLNCIILFWPCIFFPPAYIFFGRAIFSYIRAYIFFTRAMYSPFNLFIHRDIYCSSVIFLFLSVQKNGVHYIIETVKIFISYCRQILAANSLGLYSYSIAKKKGTEMSMCNMIKPNSQNWNFYILARFAIQDANISLLAPPGKIRRLYVVLLLHFETLGVLFYKIFCVERNEFVIRPEFTFWLQ